MEGTENIGKQLGDKKGIFESAVQRPVTRLDKKL